MGEKYRKTARWNGKRYEATGATELEAMTKLAEKIAAAKRGEDIIGGDMPVSRWFERWVELYKAPLGLTEKSLGMYREKYTKYIHPRIGHMKLRDVRDVHLQRILNEQTGKSKSHLDKIIILLRGLFGRARKSRLIEFDPSEDLQRPAATEGHRRALTPQELAGVLEVAEKHPNGLYILTLLYTGMRPGEAAALNWSDVDFRAGEIHIHAARESGKSGNIKAPKTAAGVRDIPIRAALLPKLKAAQGKPFTPVFPTRAGGRQNENSLRRLWLGFRRDLDIHMGAHMYRNQIIQSALAPDLTAYCLRHTFCTQLQAQGVPVHIVQYLMGHADASTTLAIYTHAQNEAVHSALRALDCLHTVDGPKLAGGKSGGN